jgi:hypothetical protein
MLTAIITLTTAGADTGNFNLYSNIDGYTAAFETGVAKSSLVAGYTSYLVPDGTTTVRVKSNATCTNYVDIPLTTITTTTTTTIPPVQATINVRTQDKPDYTAYIDVVFPGTLLDPLSVSGTVQGYTDTGCSVMSDTGTFATTLNTGFPGYVFVALSGNPHLDWQSRKFSNLVIAGQTIVTNPQNIIVGGNTYTITGYGLCETL